MSAYYEIKQRYTVLYKFIAEHTTNAVESDILNYVLSAAFRLRGASGRYSDIYRETVSTLAGKTYHFSRCDVC